MTSHTMTWTSHMTSHEFLFILVRIFRVHFNESKLPSWVTQCHIRARAHNAYISSTHDTVFISETKVTHHPDDLSLSEASDSASSESAGWASLRLPLLNFFTIISVVWRYIKNAWSPHNQRCYDVTYDMIYDVTCDMGYDKQAHSQHEK